MKLPSTSVPKLINFETKDKELGLSRFLQFSFLLFIFSLPFEALFISSNSFSSFPLLQSVGSLSRITAVFFLLAFLVKGRIFTYRSFPVFWFFLYLVIYLISVVITAILYNGELSFRIFSIPWLIIIYLVCSEVLRNKFTRDKGIKVLLFAISFCGFLQLLNAANSRVYIYSSDYLRRAAFGDDPNLAGGQYAVGVILAIIIVNGMITAGRKARIISWVMGGICLAALIQTGSRSAIFSLVISLFFFLFGNYSWKQKTKLLFGILIIVVALFLLIIQNEGLRLRFEGFFLNGDTSHRTEIYKAAIDVFKENPIFGYGPIRNTEFIGKVLGDKATDSHNVLLWVLTANGVIGLIPFLFGVLSTFLVAYKAIIGPDRAIAPLVLFSFSLIFMQTLAWNQEKLFWVILAFIASFGYQKKLYRFPYIVGENYEIDQSEIYEKLSSDRDN